MLTTLSHAQAIINLPLEPFQYSIYLAGAEPHAAWVEYAVAPAKDEDAFGSGVDDYEVALCPNTRESAKVGFTEFLPGCVIPEIERERGVWARAYKFPGLPGVLDVLSRGVKNFNFEAEGLDLDF